MIIGAIFLGVVAACAVVLLVAILRSAVEDSRAAGARIPEPTGRVILPGDREGRFTREPAREGIRDRRAEPVR